MKSYGASISWQIEKLEQVERKCGESFPGLAVGSLVPFENAVMAPLIGDAIEKCLKQSQFRGRFVHCFGANNEKLEILQSRGFQSFDTNHHAKLARSRRFYDPATKSYFGLRDKRWPRCGCVICPSHPSKHFRENRRGLKEVSTVLVALHNLQSNHLERLRQLSSPSSSGRG